MYLGPDNPEKDNCLKSNNDTSTNLNLFHKGKEGKVNKNFNVPKTYDSTSFYERSIKGFSQRENIP
jgi:hypothetical protein